MAKQSLFRVETILLLLAPIVGYSQTTLDEIINDMKLPGEGLPHGIDVDWSTKPRVGAQTPPAGWDAAIAWGQLYEWIDGNPAVNTRVQLKDLELHYLSKADHKWHLLQNALVMQGAAYVEDFAGDVSKPADIRYEPGGSVSVTAGDGYNFHFWPNSGRVNFPIDDVVGCFVTVKARLILNDSAGVDDRATAKYVLSVGGDWWQSLTVGWNQWTTNADMGIGRFRFVTPAWKSYNMYSVPEDTMRNDPPPFLEASTATALAPNGRFEGVQIFPNPATYTASVHFSLDSPAMASLSVFDSNGALVETLLDGFLIGGSHEVGMDTHLFGPGLYLLKMQHGNTIQTKRFVVLK